MCCLGFSCHPRTCIFCICLVICVEFIHIYIYIYIYIYLCPPIYSIKCNVIFFVIGGMYQDVKKWKLGGTIMFYVEIMGSDLWSVNLEGGGGGLKSWKSMVLIQRGGGGGHS